MGRPVPVHQSKPKRTEGLFFWWGNIQIAPIPSTHALAQCLLIRINDLSLLSVAPPVLTLFYLCWRCWTLQHTHPAVSSSARWYVAWRGEQVGSSLQSNRSPRRVDTLWISDTNAQNETQEVLLHREEERLSVGAAVETSGQKTVSQKAETRIKKSRILPLGWICDNIYYLDQFVLNR